MIPYSIQEISKYVKQHRFRGELLSLLHREGAKAVYVAGGIEPEARYPGDNRCAIPIRIGTVSAMEDQVTDTMRRNSPWTDRCVFFRLWTVGEGRLQRLEGLFRNEVKLVSEPARKRWYAVEPDIEVVRFCNSIKEKAWTMNIQCWQDAEFIAILEDIHRHENLRRAVG